MKNLRKAEQKRINSYFESITGMIPIMGVEDEANIAFLDKATLKFQQVIDELKKEMPN
ncbi:hypothetical protein [Aquimarina intermedia]|uniref:Uncharacterized protein n=1 Tax=Aquimarina intermedia TaxID=350814 RepID=A0A5S5BX05_9FLAO|nr:hypothetical protein [Aquimarina intermedia]TYP71534.1 hypothetical protein BD809_109116 [Aquimarina intermedia]